MSEVGLLSVVVTIVDGEDAMEELLAALVPQSARVPLEVIVPWDATVSSTAALAAKFPDVIFPGLGELTTERPITSEAGRHELFDRRRAAGLAAAGGDLVAILEDRGVPRGDWAETVVRLHAENEHAVIGGAIECAPRQRLLNWSFWVTDFGRYGLPFEAHEASWVSDVNVTYKRRAVDATRELWRERFREPIVHWGLIERGESMLLSPELVVLHRRPPATLGELIPERFHWGRLFGHIRAMHLSAARRLVYALAGPLIPLLLLVRHGRVQARRGRLGRYLRAAPLVAILLVAWTTGEVWGYVTRRA